MRMKLKLLLPTLLTLLCFLGVRAADTSDVVLDFTKKTNWSNVTFPKGASKTGSEEGGKELSSSNGTYSIDYVQCYHNDGGYLMMWQKEGQLTLPAFGKKIAKISITNNKGASEKAVLDLYKQGESTVLHTYELNDAKNGAVTFDYELEDTDKDANTRYVLKVVGANSVQVTKITVYFDEESGSEEKQNPKLSWGLTDDKFTCTVGDDWDNLDYPKLSYPEDLDPKNIKYSIYPENDDVAVIDEETGYVVLGDTPGTVTVTATFTGDDVYKESSASYELEVKDGRKEPNLSWSDPGPFEIQNNVTSWTRPTVIFPDDLNLTATALKWTSSNTDVATVSKSGVVSLMENVGTAVISATFEGNEVYLPQTISFTINVVEHRQSPNLALDPATDSYTIKSNETFTAPKVVAPAGVTVKWSTNNAAVATVNATTGAVTVKGIGTAVITASNVETADYYADSVSYTLIVEDYHVAPGLSLSAPGPFTVKGNETFTAPQLVVPTGLDMSKVTWKAEPADIVSVESNGVVTLKEDKYGKVTITASFAGDNAYLPESVSYELTVIDPNGPIKFIAGDQNWTNTQQISSWEDDTETVKFTFGGSGTKTAYYSSGAQLRIYKDNKLTITASNGFEIDKVVFVTITGTNKFESSKTNNVSPSVSTLTDESETCTWSNFPSGTSVCSMTMTAQVRVTEIHVYLRAPLPKIGVSVDNKYQSLNYTVGDTAANVFDLLSITGLEQGKDVSASDFDFTSDNTAVVSFSTENAGQMIINAVGEAKITAKFKGNDYYQPADPVTITVSVTAKPTLPIEFKDPLETTLDLYGTKTLNFFDLLKNELTGDQKGNFSFSSSDSNIATVSSKGVVTGKATGNAVITAVYNGDGTYGETTKTFTVTVIDGRATIELSFPEKEYLYMTNDKDPFQSPALSGNAGKTIVWSSSDSALATVDQTGKVKLTEVGGSVVITAKFAGDETTQPAEASYTIIVVDPNEPFILGKDQKDLFEKPTNLNGASYTDPSGLVTFSFASNGVTSVPKYHTDSSLRIYSKNSLTISVAEGYYISHVAFVHSANDGRFTDQPTVTDGSIFYTPKENETDYALWDFSSVNLSSGTLTSNASIYLDHIKVYIRPAVEPKKIVLKPIDSSITCYKGNHPTKANANFTAENLEEGDSIENLHIHYTSSDTSVAYITEDMGIEAPGVGTTTITARFDGDFRYAPTSASYTLTVTDKKILEIYYINDNDVIEYDLNDLKNGKQLNVMDIIDWDRTQMSGDQKKDLEFDSTNKNVATVTGNGVITISNSAKERDKTEIKIHLPEVEEGEYAAVNESFTIVIVDRRAEVKLQFEKPTDSYDVNTGEPYKTLELNGAEGLKGIVWTSSDETIATVENGIVTIIGKPGTNNVTIKAEFPGDSDHKPASASYRLTVTGPAFTVDEFLSSSVSGGITIRGYIVGYVTGTNSFTNNPSGFKDNNNFCIAQNIGETDMKKVVPIEIKDETLRKTYGLMAHPEYLYRQVLITGTAGTYFTKPGVKSVSSIQILEDADFEISSVEIAPNATVILTSNEEGVNEDDINYVVTGNEGILVSGNGSKVHFPAETALGEYMLIASHHSETSKYPASKIFTVNVVEGETVTVRYVHSVNSDWAEHHPHVYIETVTGTLYTDGWAKMEDEGKNHHFGKPYYSYSFNVPASEISAERKRVIKKGPDFGDTTEETDAPVVVTPTNSADHGTSNLHLSFGNPDADAEPVLVANAPIGANMVYAASEEPVTLYVFDGDSDTVIATITNVGGSTPNLWKGEITGYESYLKEDNNQKYLEFVIGSRQGENGEAIKTGTLVGASSEMTYADATSVSEGILSYMDYVNKHHMDPNWTEAEKNQYYEDLIEAGKNSVIDLKSENVSGDDTTSNVNKIVINVSALETGTDFKVGNPLYIAAELGGSDGKSEVNALSLSINDDDIMVEVEEIGADADGEVMWFNMCGERIPEPTEGLVIRVQGGKAEKLYLRR